MTARRSFRRAAPSRLLLLLVFACLGAGLTACARARSTPRLVGRGGIRLRAAAGTYLRFVITPGLDPVVVRQWSRDGAVVRGIEVQADPDQPTHLSWLVDEPGLYVFTISVAPGVSPQTAGIYAMALEEQRPAGPCDTARLLAERQVGEARLLLWNQGDPARALALSGSGADAAAQIGELEIQAAAQLEQASGAESSDRHSSAESYRQYEQARDLARRTGDRHAEAAALAGASHWRQAPTEDFDRAVQLELALRDMYAEASLYQWRGKERENGGDADGAISDFELALDREARIGDVAAQSLTFELLGSLRRMMGDTEAEPVYLDLAATLAGLAGDRARAASIESERAQLDAALGKIEAARDRYQEAYLQLSPPRTRDERREAAGARYGYAMALLYLGQPRQAHVPLLDARRAFSALRDAENLAFARLGLGAAWQAENQADEALATYQQVLGELQDPDAPAVPKVLALYLLGKAHAEGQPVRAAGELRDALRLGAGFGVQFQAQIQLALAQALLRVHDDVKAEDALAQAVGLAHGAHAPVVEAAALAVRAKVDLARGRLAAARAAIARAVQLTEDLRAGVLRPDQRIDFLAARRGYYETLVEVLARLDGRAAFAASEQARARDLLDRLEAQKVDVRQIVPADLKLRQRGIEDAIEQTQRRLLTMTSLPLRGRGGYVDAAVARFEADLARDEREERSLADDIERRHPGYAQIRAASPPPLAEVQRLLDARTALLEYFVGEKGSFLFVVTRQGLHIHPVPAKPRLETLVRRVDDVLARDSRLRGESFADDSYQLYQALVRPAAAELEGKTRLLVAADDLLYRVSFEALLTTSVPGASRPRRDLPYLVRDRTISYVPSAGVLSQLMRKHWSSGGSAGPAQLFVGFGDPQTPLSPAGPALAPPGLRTGRERSVPLPAANDEVRAIGAFFPAGQRTVFLGPAASVENVQRDPRVAAARFLHFASHALLDVQRPDRSGLQLAAGAGARQDGLLRVRDVFDLNLSADLVVLSACSTGLGKEVAGEGVLGLTRAFLYAGAAGVVVSLWPVDDEATGELMKRFYRYLLSPVAAGDPAEALRRAKLDLLKMDYSHPYYWAPFILTGGPR